MELKEKMSAEISEKLESAFDAVVKERSEHYRTNPPVDTSRVDSLIGSSALANAAISGGSSLIPGPWGMLATIPEIVLVSRNQIALICDVAAAYGKKDVMSRDLAAAVFVSALGSSAGSVIVLQGGKYLIRRTSLQVFQKLVAILGGKITQQALKSAVSKWLPGIGAAAMATWTNYMTRQIGKKAKEIFAKDVVFEDVIADLNPIPPVSEEVFSAGSSGDVLRSMDYYKIQILTNLAKIDGNVADVEIDVLTEMIGRSEAPYNEKELLLAGIRSKERRIDGIEIIAASPDDAIALLSDLTALAKRDGLFHITEKLYIKQIGKLLGFSTVDVDEVISG